MLKTFNAKNRYHLADEIQNACNPLAVVNALQRIVREVYDETDSMTKVRDDAAVKAILGKLCDMCGISHGEEAYTHLFDLLKNEERI